MARIAFLAPYPSSLETCRRLTEGFGLFDVFHVHFDEDADTAADLRRQGYETVVARGGMADRLRHATPSLNVVDLRVGTFDLIRTIEETMRHGNRIGVIAFHSLLRGIGTLARILKVDLVEYEVANARVIPDLVARAKADGVDAIVGGGLASEVAARIGLPAGVVVSGEEAISTAAEEAVRIHRAVESEKMKRGLFEAILDSVHDGIIAVDDTQRVTLANRRAREILRRSGDAVLGLPVGRVLPGVAMTGVLRNGESEVNTILEVGEVKTLLSKVPIMVGGCPKGGILSFQETSRIQKAEAKVRKELFDKGHVARMTFDDVRATNRRFGAVIDLAKTYAATNSSILIVGETGTGKEVIAQSIHNHGSRRGGPFVAVNCAALPAQILESELFGYVGGAFTGAARDGKIGLFELAHGGTIFLDEISEMDYANQSRLLRVLQERTVMRLGSDRVTHVDCRVISATNRDLRELVRTAKFRDDLYFRLDVLAVRLPPLRERREDVLPLLTEFLHRLSPSGRAPEIDPAAAALLSEHRWPGNVRELRNIAERLVAVSCGQTIRPFDVRVVLDSGSGVTDLDPERSLAVDEIRTALVGGGGSKTRAAALLGVDRTTLWRRMKRLGLS